MRYPAGLSALVLAICFVDVASAQNCYQKTNNVSFYTSATTDGTNVYGTALIEGVYSMTATPPCVIPLGAHHYGFASGQLIAGSGAKSPGNVANSGYVCMSCYFSAQDSEDLPIEDDIEWDFEAGGQAVCTSAGLLVGFPKLGKFLYISATYGLNNPPNQFYVNSTICNYKPACSNGVKPSCGSGGWAVTQPGNTNCSVYIRNGWLWSVDQTGFKTCEGVAFPASGPGPCS